MRIGIISGVFGLTVVLPAHAQKSDSIKSLLLPDVVVTESYQQRQAKKSALAVDVVDQDFLRKHFTGMGSRPRTGTGCFQYRNCQCPERSFFTTIWQ